ncbi:MAG: hypothetical protein JSR45_10560 [Proteobacteria bacterium]|nr:hypothetical protein [Pseudomonadota bacterium]
MTRLERLGRWAAFAVALGGFALYATHPRVTDPLRSLGMALCFLATMSNLVLLGVRAREEWAALPWVERWLLRSSGVPILVGAFWHVVELLAPTLPSLSAPLVTIGAGVMALAFVLGVVRRSRMPKHAERPHALVLD